jgi:hypothetical protein
VSFESLDPVELVLESLLLQDWPVVALELPSLQQGCFPLELLHLS